MTGISVDQSQLLANLKRITVYYQLTFSLVIVALLTCTLYVDYLNNRNHVQQIRADVLKTLSIVRAQLEGDINANVQAVQGLVAAIHAEPGMNQERFQKFAKPLFDNKNQLRSLAAAPDLIISMIYPYEGNENAIGLDFTKNKLQKEAALRARDSRNLVLTGPVKLIQGGQGFIGRFPVYLKDTQNQQESFWGLVSAVIDVELLYKSSGISDTALSVAITSIEPDAPQRVFFGNPDVWNHSPITLPIKFPGSTWVLAAMPEKGWPELADNAGELRLLLLLFSLAVLLPFLKLLQVTRQNNDNEIRLQGLFDLSPVGIALNDYDTGAFVEINDAVLQPTGYTKDEFSKLSYWDITPRKYESAEALQIDSLQQTGAYGPYEKEYIRKDGTHYPVLLRGILIQDSSGRKYIWSIIEDISESKATERSLIQSKEMAESAAKAKSEFLATMSHEIRTPMNGVIGMLTLLEKSQLGADQSRQVQVAKSSAESLLTLINDILDFSKVDAGKLEFEAINFDLQALLGEVIEAMRFFANKKNLALILDLTDLPHTEVNGDPGRLRQIVNNLMGNAIKFTESGSVTLRGRIDEHYRFTGKVIDTGIGIDKAQQDTLFEAFTQVDASTTRKYGGTGLGLAICKRLCDLMDGTISVESYVNGGSTFTFSVQLKPPSKPEEQHRNPQIDIDDKPQLAVAAFYNGKNNADSASAERPSDASESHTILIVEDNPFNQEVASMLLEEIGYKTEIANNGFEALGLLKENSYSLILMDCQMPVLDGYQTTSKIRSGEAGENHRKDLIIAMTANAMRGDAEKCIAAGMDDYLSKPIDIKLLDSTLQKWLHKN
ncbi:MAG: ATP-binding protein [Pseudomonadales bacterium]|nr:ATP-binding protein [Pseudomonadales bacterium]